MRKQAGLGALLLISVGVVLGATVFRSDIAQATGLAPGPNVVVTNTPAQAVPVREQNLDGGNIKVHEQGTAKVDVVQHEADTFGALVVPAAAGAVKIEPLGKTVRASFLAITGMFG